MKWLALAAGVLVLAVVSMVLIGTRLPVSHVARRSRKYATGPAELFARVESDLAAQKPKLDFEVVERVAPSRLVTRIAPGGPFGGTWTYAVSPDGDGATLEIVENGEVYNPLFRFLSRFVFGHTMTIDACLARLQAPNAPAGR